MIQLWAIHVMSTTHQTCYLQTSKVTSRESWNGLMTTKWSWTNQKWNACLSLERGYANVWKTINSQFQWTGNSWDKLSVLIDDKLSFDDRRRRRTLQKTVTTNCRIKKIRRFLPIRQRILCYNSLIKQVMMYSSTPWTSCSVDNSHQSPEKTKQNTRSSCYIKCRH